MRFKNSVLSGFVALSMLCAAAYALPAVAEDAVISDSLEASGENSKEDIKKVPENIGGLLKALGLTDEDEINSEGFVSRAVAADVLLRFEKIYDGGTATGNMYTDVSADDEYAYAIEAASKSGWFFGTGNGRFSPDDNITPLQMAAVLLRFAGYRDGYFTVNKEINELLKNTDNYEYLTYYGLAVMLYNFLDINIVEASYSYPYDIGYTKSKTITVLNNCFDIYTFKGIITENGITGLWSESDLGKNRVRVSGNTEKTVFDTGETDIEFMIGRSAEVYYKYDKEKNLPVCVYYDVSDKRNTIYETDLYDIDYKLSGENQIEYYNGGVKNQRIKYNRKTAIIYNGTYYGEAPHFLNKINGKEGRLTSVDNDGDGTADVIDIEAYDTFVVNSVVLSSGTVFFKNDGGAVSLKEDDYDRFIMTDENGKSAYPEDFVDGTVLSVARNSSSAKIKAVKVLVSEKKVNGSVTEISEDSYSRTVINLDGIADYTLLKNVSAPAVGQGIIAAINAFGNVAWIDYSNAGSFSYGIITYVSKDKASDGVLIKMITAQNTIELFEVKDKITVDKDVYKNTNELYKKLYSEDSMSVGNYQFPAGIYPVRYRLRADGSLAELDTGAVGNNENSNTFELMASGEYAEKGLVMGGIFAIRESTPVFRIRAISNGGVVEREFFEDTKYMAMSDAEALISSGGVYNCAAYKVDKDNLFADFIIVCSGWGGYDYSDSLLVIDKIGKAYDEATGQVLKSVHGYRNGFEKNIIVSDAFEEEFDSMGLVSGDVIRYSVDVYDHLIDIEDGVTVIKHLKDDEGKNSGIELGNISKGRTSLDDFRGDTYSTQMIFGYVLERRDDFIRISVIPPGSKTDGTRSDEDLEKDTVLIKIPSAVPITVYNPSEPEKVYVSTYDEILDYAHSGKNCSLLALHFRSAKLLEIVVLNDYSLYE